MLAELEGKGGCLCKPAKEGTLRCPLIVRPTSEDVVTGNLFGLLQAINPRWWLPDLLNRGLDIPSTHPRAFRQQIYQKLRIQLWQKQPLFPKNLIPWDEGSTEVDVVIMWENPPTTIFIEMKYGSPLSASTSNNCGDHGYPSDQLIRNARIGLHRCGWYREDVLFEQGTRDFVLLLLTPTVGSPLMRRYRDVGCLYKSIPHSQQLIGLPRQPFIGELSYGCVSKILQARIPMMNSTEKTLTRRLMEYLEFKTFKLREGNGRGH